MRTYPIIVGMITNGYLLTADRIQRLNRAGLDHLQISIDNVMPDDVSKKSLKVLDKKLQLLAEHADFHVNINSVVGGGTRNPHDALVVGRRAVQLGFTSTIGIIHDGDGQLQPLARRRARSLSEDEEPGEEELLALQLVSGQHRHGKPNEWRCRAGARYLYICEDGLVHYCSQQRGYPGSSAGAVLGAGHSPRVPHREKLRAALHRVVRAPGVVHRFLARAADAAGAAGAGRSGTTRTD